MAIVADIHTDVGELRLEDRIAEIAGFEIELLPKARRAVGNVMFAIFPKVLAIGINDGGRVVVNTLDVFLVNRDDHHYAVFLRDFAHELNGGAVWNFFDHAIPAGGLLRAEVWTGENFLHAQDLCPFSRGLIDELQVLFNRFILDLLERFFRRRRGRRLN